LFVVLLEHICELRDFFALFAAAYEFFTHNCKLNSLFEGHSKFTIIDDILQTASAFNLTALVSEKLDTAQFIGTDRLGANDLVLDQVFQRKPFVARSARDDVAHQNLEHKR